MEYKYLTELLEDNNILMTNYFKTCDEFNIYLSKLIGNLKKGQKIQIKENVRGSWELSRLINLKKSQS